ncbi:hypothetical protein NA56DRAFT_699590 [Hyaloscypha hepaticicola]|uniref:Uncharacterized protein n=1 Tax=Hyaloscypha hepaticicola TaxID=2082293 RepID=A0A2J6QEU0_9HELO|nr:hypothetical protein NA56DRAFT_699590 [Hyaloscypha hepaticicola]
MASSSHDLSNDEEVSEAELAQISEAFAQIAKGERTAQALESNLTSLEKKIDDLLASFEESERLKVEEANSKRVNPSSEKEGGNNDEKI